MVANAMSSGTHLPDTAQVIIFKTPNRDVTITNLGLEVVGAGVASRLANIGIYEINHDAFDSGMHLPFFSGRNMGEVDNLDCSSGGVKSGAVNIALKKNRAYMSVLNSGGGAGSGLTLRCISGSGNLQGVGLLTPFSGTVGVYPWWGAASFTFTTPLPESWTFTYGASANLNTTLSRGISAANPVLTFAAIT